MRQSVYTCCRCGREQRTAGTTDGVEDVPLGWARVAFDREQVITEGDERTFSRQTVVTHACTDCGETLLAYLEHALRGIDSSFDDGGAS